MGLKFEVYPEGTLVEERVKDATKILNLLRSMSGYKPHFEIIGNYRLIDDGIQPEATIMLKANGKEMHEADTGAGPVDALAKVLNKSLKTIFPEVDEIKLIDFSSRIFDPGAGTAAGVEVEILFSNGKDAWRVKAFSENICKASFLALVDGFEYGIYISKGEERRKSFGS
jgi:2-isopropylmalate synthase